MQQFGNEPGYTEEGQYYGNQPELDNNGQRPPPSKYVPRPRVDPEAEGEVDPNL